MANPKWFVAKDYMAAKLAQVQAIDPQGNWTAASLTKVMEEAGYKGDDGAYQHFNDFGMAENVSPNALFNVTEYLAAKAAQMNASLKAGETAWTEASILKAITDANMTVWGHYQAFGSKEDVNPSNAFDAALYLEAKAAAMNAAGEKQADGSEWTAAAVEDAIHNANMSVLEHFTTFAGAGKGEVAADATFADPTPVTPTPGFDPFVPVVDPVVGETKYLTVDQDNITGTVNNDTFNATIFDNQNTLQSGDRVDGGAGHDVLNADLGTSALFAATPEIKNVEVIKFRAQANAKDSGSNNVAGTDAARVDAQRISAGDDGKLQLWSQDSRADLIIEDVRVNSNLVTIGMGNTDPGNVDLKVYFNNQYLKADNSTTTGKLSLQLIDTVGALTTAQGGHDCALWDNPYTGFNFTLNGTSYKIDFGTYNNTKDESPSYEELVALIQKTINEDATLSKLGLTVALGDSFNAKVGIGTHIGEDVTGKIITVTSSQGELVAGSWIASNGLPSTNSTSATMDVAQNTTCPLIKTNVSLDNVGQVLWDDAHTECLPDESIFGSEAGDLVIGAMGTRGGVERFDVTVEQGSWLSSMSSTNNTLRMVTVKNGDTGNDGVDAGAGKGQLFIGNSLYNNGNHDMVSWEDAARLLSTNGLTDVKTFDASEMGGVVNLGAQITEAAYNKYLKDVDGVESSTNASTNGAFTYTLGSNNDTLNMKVAGKVAGDNDFSLTINTGAGDDLVNFTFDGFTANQLANQMALKNVSIATGAGNDTVKFWGDGAVKVDGGAGNDALYVGQNATDVNAVWVMNAKGTGAALAVYNDAMKGAQSLDNDVLSTTASFAYTGATAGESLQVSVTFKGITVKANIGKMETAAGSFTAEEVNAAIISAIANDATLSKLVVAKDGAGHALLVESLIDGLMTGADLTFDFTAVKADGTAGTTDPTTTTLDAAYGADGNAFGTYAALLSTGVEATTGATGTPEVQIATIDNVATAIAVGDQFSIMVNGTLYTTTTALATDATVASLLTSLNTAKDAAGNALTTVLTLAASGTTGISMTTTGTLADLNIADIQIFKMNGQTTGSASTAHSDNIINGGTGDDLLVLGTGALSNDTVKFDAGFGHDIVLNFTKGAVSDTNTGADKMDFSSFFAAGKMLGSNATIGTTVANNSVVKLDVSGVDALANIGNADGKLTIDEVIKYINSDSVKLGAAADAAGDIVFIVNGIEGAKSDYYVFSADVAKDSAAITGATAEGSITLQGVDAITDVVLA